MAARLRRAWAELPQWARGVLAVYLAGFVASVRRAGVWLAAGVMTLDVAANWIGNWPSLQKDPARLLHPVGLLPITLFGVFVLATTLPGSASSGTDRTGWTSSG